MQRQTSIEGELIRLVVIGIFSLLKFRPFSECLRSLNLVGDKLQPAVDFVRNQQIVRTSLYDAAHKYLFTAGESGIIHFWRPTDADLPNAIHLKEKHRNHKHHTRPY